MIAMEFSMNKVSYNTYTGKTR